jgi:two-component system sensor histidine kinase YesM
MRLKFQAKLLLALIAVLLMTAGTISYIWYTHSRNIVTETMLQSTELLLNERVREIDGVLTAIDYQSRVLSLNNAVVDRGIGNKWENDYLNLQAAQRLNQYIDSVYASSLSITGIELMNDRGDYYGRGIRRGYAFIRERGIDERLADKRHKLLIVPYYDDKGQTIKEILFIRNVYYYEKAIGYSIISIDCNVFQQAFEGIFPPHAFVVMRAEDSDEPLYTEGAAGGRFRSIRAYLDRGMEGKHFIRDREAGEWLVIGRTIPKQGLLVQVAVPMQDIMSSIKSKFKTITMIAAIMLAALLLIAALFSKWMSRNVAKLTKAITRFSEGDLLHTLAVRGNDEFSQVAAAFNRMTRSIRQLLADIQAKEREKREMEVRALQGQINLHFLFNALNTIKNLAYIQRIANIERLVGSLMELLHLSMAKGRDFITLEDEINYVEHYLEIYRYKSVRPIECIVQIDEQARDAVIPKFMLQPIVENAIIHGIEADEDDKDGVIRIEVKRDQHELDIAVTDNGKGFDRREARTFNGIGLSNTERRIKMYFGEAYGLRVESIPNQQTAVYIRIPYRKEMPA